MENGKIGKSTDAMTWKTLNVLLVRSTRPNEFGHKYLSVRMYVCLSTKSLFDFNEIWHVGRGR